MIKCEDSLNFTPGKTCNYRIHKIIRDDKGHWLFISHLQYFRFNQKIIEMIYMIINIIIFESQTNFVLQFDIFCIYIVLIHSSNNFFPLEKHESLIYVSYHSSICVIGQKCKPGYNNGFYWYLFTRELICQFKTCLALLKYGNVLVKCHCRYIENIRDL